MNVAKIPQIQPVNAAEIARDFEVSNLERMTVLRAIDVAPSSNLAQRRIADRLHALFCAEWDWLAVLNNGIAQDVMRLPFFVRLSIQEMQQLKQHLHWALERGSLPNAAGRPITAVYDRLVEMLEPHPKEGPDNGT